MGISDKKSVPFPKNWLLNTGIKGKNIGVLTPGYGLEKVSYGLEPYGYYYKKINRIPFQKFSDRQTVLTQCPVIIGAKIELVHSFNMLPLNKNFIVSFENELPRFFGDDQEKYIKFGYDILQSDRCKGIFGLSEASKKVAQKRMIEYGYSDLAKKVNLFRGGLNIPEKVMEKSMSGPLQVCLVGENLAHKGIEGTVRGLKKLRNGGIDIEFTVIGRFDNKDLKNPDYYIDAKSISNLLQNESWITHHLEISNFEVLKLFQQCHLMIMPSIDESLGWVMIEAALCSTARIGINSFAMPELINHNQDGWLIDIELNDNVRWKHYGQKTARKNWPDVQQLIADKIIDFIGASDVDHQRLYEMGNQAKIAMSKLYSKDAARDQLSKIYQRALF